MFKRLHNVCVVSRACPPSLRPRLGSPVPGPAHWPVVRMREQARGPDAEAVGVGKCRRSAGAGCPAPGVTLRDVTSRCAEYRVYRSTLSLGHRLGVARSVSARQGHDTEIKSDGMLSIDNFIAHLFFFEDRFYLL